MANNADALAITMLVVSILLFIYAYRVWSGNAYSEIQGVPQDENAQASLARARANAGKSASQEEKETT